MANVQRQTESLYPQQVSMEINNKKHQYLLVKNVEKVCCREIITML